MTTRVSVYLRPVCLGACTGAQGDVRVPVRCKAERMSERARVRACRDSENTEAHNACGGQSCVTENARWYLHTTCLIRRLLGCFDVEGSSGMETAYQCAWLACWNTMLLARVGHQLGSIRSMLCNGSAAVGCCTNRSRLSKAWPMGCLAQGFSDHFSR